MPDTHGLFIDGKPTEGRGGETIVRDPSTNAEIASVCRASADDVDRAATLAHQRYTSNSDYFVQTMYDDQFGFPTAITEGIRSASDGQSYITISNFKVLP